MNKAQKVKKVLDKLDGIKTYKITAEADVFTVEVRGTSIEDAEHNFYRRAARGWHQFNIIRTEEKQDEQSEGSY
jgi:hypothetical protein